MQIIRFTVNQKVQVNTYPKKKSSRKHMCIFLRTGPGRLVRPIPSRTCHSSGPISRINQAAIKLRLTLIKSVGFRLDERT